MCGRLSIHDLDAVRVLAELLHVPQAEIDLRGMQARYNTQPTHQVPVIWEVAGRHVLNSMAWGWQVPRARNRRSARHINARSETVYTLPTFKRAARNQRCIVIANGYFEWERDFQDRPLEPHYIHPRHQEWLAIAGIYQVVQDGSRECALLTMPPNAAMAKIHHRMPCVLDLDGVKAWMEADTPERAAAVLQVVSGEYLSEHRVSDRVNKVSNEEPGLIDPVKAPPRQLDWLGMQ